MLVAGVAPGVAGAQVTTVDFGTPSGFACLVGGVQIDFGAPIGGLNFGGLRRAQVGGDCVATNSGLGTNTATITGAGGSQFSLRSADLAGAFSTTSVSITGSLGGNVVFMQALNGLPNGQTATQLFTSPNQGPIDRLEITATGAAALNQPFIVDNFTFAPVQVAAVPEPSTVALLAPAIVGVIGARARRRRRGAH